MKSQPQNPEFRNNPENFHPFDSAPGKTQISEPSKVEHSITALLGIRVKNPSL